LNNLNIIFAALITLIYSKIVLLRRIEDNTLKVRNKVQEVEDKPKRRQGWSEYILVKVDKATKEKANEIARARGLTLSALLRIYLIALTKEQ
jgi:hypothetical protein